MKYHHKWVMKNQKNGNLNTHTERSFVIQIWASLKMQKIITQRSSSRQLLETVNFAFMKIFDSLVKQEWKWIYSMTASNDISALLCVSSVCSMSSVCTICPMYSIWSNFIQNFYQHIMLLYPDLLSACIQKSVAYSF